MTQTRRPLVQSTVLLVGSNLLLQALGFAYRVFLGRVGGAGAMGLFHLVMPAYAVIMSLTFSGITTAVTGLTSRHLAMGRTEDNARLVRLALGLFFLAFAVVALPVALGSEWLASTVLGDSRTRVALLIMLPCLLLTGVENIFKGHFYGVDNVRLPVVSDQMEQIVRIGTVLALFLLVPARTAGGATALILLGMTVSELFSSSFLALRYRRARAKEPPQTREVTPGLTLLKRTLAVALPVAGGSLLNNLLASANTLLLPGRLQAAGLNQGEAVASLGVVLGMATPLLLLPMAFVGPIATILLPQFAQDSALKDHAGIARRLGKALHAVGLLGLPTLAILVPLGPLLMELLYHQTVTEHTLLLLAGDAALLFYQLITASAMNGLDMQGRVLGHVVAGGLLQLAFTWFATAQLGMDGFLWGQIASALLIVGLNLRALARRTNLQVRWAEWFVLTALGALVLGLTVRLIHGALLGWLAEGPAVGLSLGAGAGVYLVVLRLMGIHPWAMLRGILPAKWKAGRQRAAALSPSPAVRSGGQ